MFFDANAELADMAAGSYFVLTGAEARHASSVRRMRPDEPIQVTNGRGLRIRGVVLSSESDKVSIRVNSAEVEAAASPQLVLVQALAKGDRDELAVQAATELGVSEVMPWQAERSISRWEGPKVAKQVERWQQICLEAAKQALRTFVPKVTEPLTSKQLAALVSDFAQVLVLDPTAEVALSGLSLAEDGRVAIVVGPEGGISSAELALLEGAGATRVRLGAEVLRTSTAGVAAIAVIQARSGNWA